MITSAEAKLGRNMAVVAAAGLILSILIPVVLIGIDGGNGYNPTWPQPQMVARTER